MTKKIHSQLQTTTVLVANQPGVELGAPPEDWAQMISARAATIPELPAEWYPNLVECGAASVNCDDENAYYHGGVAPILAANQGAGRPVSGVIARRTAGPTKSMAAAAAVDPTPGPGTREAGARIRAPSTHSPEAPRQGRRRRTVHPVAAWSARPSSPPRATRLPRSDRPGPSCTATLPAPSRRTDLAAGNAERLIRRAER